MKRLVRIGKPCPHCGGQVIRFQSGAVCCLSCNRKPNEPRLRFDPDREAGRPDPVRRGPSNG